MEINFSDLKKKKVVNVNDGRELGKVTDLLFSWAEGRILGFIVGKKSLFSDDELIISPCCVTKIGSDTVLVSLADPNHAESCACTDETIE